MRQAPLVIFPGPYQKLLKLFSGTTSGARHVAALHDFQGYGP
jgi:hypothetical protein